MFKKSLVLAATLALSLPVMAATTNATGMSRAVVTTTAAAQPQVAETRPRFFWRWLRKVIHHRPPISRCE